MSLRCNGILIYIMPGRVPCVVKRFTECRAVGTRRVQIAVTKIRVAVINETNELTSI